jgi:hypothetical protein
MMSTAIPVITIVFATLGHTILQEPAIWDFME